MATDLTSAIVLFGIMAAVSLHEAVAVLSVFAAGALFLHRLMQVIRRIEERQVTPAVNRLNAILDDVKGVTSTVKEEAARVDRLMHLAGDVIGRCRTGGRASSTPS